MEVVDYGALDDERRAALEGGEADPFDAAAITLAYRRKDRHVGLCEAGRLVAQAGMVDVSVEVGGVIVAAVGIGGVIVAAPHRGRGLARRVVEEALVRARATGAPFAILFCHEDRMGLYRRLGFAEVPAPVSVAQPGGPATMRQRTMWRALDPAALWPPGPVAVLSLPF